MSDAVDVDAEMQAWRAQWQSGPATSEIDAPAAIRAHVRRRTLLLVAWMTAEVSVTGAIAIFLLTRALVAREPVDALAMWSLLAASLGAVGFSLWNWSAGFRPFAETTAAFLELSFARCRRFDRALTAGWVLLWTEVAIFVPWIVHVTAWRGVPGRLRGFGFLLCFVVPAAALLFSLRRRTDRERSTLEALARELGLEPGFSRDSL